MQPLDSISKTIRPQDDLFRYVNQNWFDKTQIPEDKAAWGNFLILREDSLNAVRAILEDDQTLYDSPNVYNLYKLFMDENTVENKQLGPIKNILSQIDNAKNMNDLTDILLEHQKYLSFAPYVVFIEPETENTKINGVYLSQSGIHLDKDHFELEEHQEIRDKFKVHLRNVFELLNYQNPSECAELMYSLESELANAQYSNVDNRDPQKTHNLKKVKEFKKEIDDLPLIDVISDDELVIDVRQPEFFTKLKDVWNDSYFSKWQNCFRYECVNSFAKYLSSNIAYEFFDFYSKTLAGVNKMEERWKLGVNTVNSLLGGEVGQIYVKKHFIDEAKSKMDQLVANLIKSYEVSINKSLWLTDQTKAKALEKLSKFTPKVGYPLKYEVYDINLTDDLVESVINIRIAKKAVNYAKIGNEVDHELWEMTPQTVNAYYSPLENKIVFPAAILQPPFFGVELSDAQNYGGIGVVIGHEIGHGFDDQGSQYDGEGKLNNWWSDEDRNSFEKLAHKLSSQFSKFVPKQLENDLNPPHVNGELTNGENIGDLSGLKISLQALAFAQNYSSIEDFVTHQPDQTKEFFIQYALVWRQKSRDEMMRQQLVMDPHSPAEFRGNAVRNVDAFHEVFETKVGDGLYLPKSERVDIW